MITIEDLRHITYSVTHACNLQCLWCYQGSSPFESHKYTLDHRIKVLAKLASPLRNLTITGGEPFTYPELDQLLKFAGKSYRHVGITSNSLAIREKHLVVLKRYRMSVSISIDGLQKLHDRVRGNGSFLKTKEKIFWLLAEGIPISVQITACKELSQNLDDLEELIVEIADWGVYGITTQRLIPQGRGSDVEDELVTPDDHIQFGKRLKKISEKIPTSVQLKSKDSIHRTISNRREKKDNIIAGGCRAGLSYLYVDLDGTAYPCPFLLMRVGNVLEQSVSEVWLENKLLRDLRKRESYIECKDCDHFSVCRGCRAHAYLFTGNVFGKDPLCKKSKQNMMETDFRNHS